MSTRLARLLVTLLGLALLGSMAPAAVASTAERAEPAAPAVPAAASSAIAGRAGVPMSKLEKKALKIINKRRAANGCRRPLVAKAKLTTAARGHNTRMVDAGTLSHQLPGEPSLPDRVSATGYRWSRLAENLAMTPGGAKGVVKAWLGSPDHRRNLLDCGLRQTGIVAVRQGGAVWWTQVFAKR